MSDNYNEVYVQDTSEEQSSSYQEITPEYVYLTIPSDYVCVYHKLLLAMADFGKSIIDDCSAACKGNGKQLVNCWNLFQSAIACRTLGRESEATLFINYIKAQLETIYKGSGKTNTTDVTGMAITDDGYLKAFVTCNNENATFYVDEETGVLYQERKDNADNGKVYTIEDDNLVVTDSDT